MDLLAQRESTAPLRLARNLRSAARGNSVAPKLWTYARKQCTYRTRTTYASY